MTLQYEKLNNDSARWKKTKSIKTMMDLDPFAKVYGLAAQGSIKSSSLLTLKALNPHIACKASDFAQLAYIPYNQRTDVGQTWSEEMYAQFLAQSNLKQWYLQHPLYKEGLQWLKNNSSFKKFNPKTDTFTFTLEEGAVELKKVTTDKSYEHHLLKKKELKSESYSRKLKFFEASEARAVLKGWTYKLFEGIAGKKSKKALEPFGFVAKGKLNNADIVFIAFRGTQGDSKTSSPDWRTDFNMEKTDFYTKEVVDHFSPPATYNNYFFRPIGKVHKGFRDTYVSTRNQILSILSDFGLPYQKDRKKLRDYPLICVTGHSLGGALSTVCTADLFCLGYDVVLYNFASPRVGGETFSEWFNIRFALTHSTKAQSYRAWRINRRQDPVPHTPTGPDAVWKHVKNLWQLDSKDKISPAAHDMEEHRELTYTLSGNGGYKAITTKEVESVRLDPSGNVIDNKNQFIKGTIKKGLTKVQVPINLKK
ncbi:MAG: lipase family protein [Deltaproteobacteria bacterium]|nr:lipase family protein [Deltaproteobacteria bacterium]